MSVGDGAELLCEYVYYADIRSKVLARVCCTSVRRSYLVRTRQTAQRERRNTILLHVCTRPLQPQHIGETCLSVHDDDVDSTTLANSHNTQQLSLCVCASISACGMPIKTTDNDDDGDDATAKFVRIIYNTGVNSRVDLQFSRCETM